MKDRFLKHFQSTKDSIKFQLTRLLIWSKQKGFKAVFFVNDVIRDSSHAGYFIINIFVALSEPVAIKSLVF